MGYFRGHLLIEFRDQVGAIRSGLEPFPRVFFVARMLLLEGTAEVRPLTVRAFFGAVLTNMAWDLLWAFRHVCWLVGFLDFNERRMAEANYHGDWRWRWWLPRVGRAPGPPPRVDVVCPKQHQYFRPVESPADLPCPFCLAGGSALVMNPALQWSEENGSIWEPVSERGKVSWKRIRGPRPRVEEA